MRGGWGGGGRVKGWAGAGGWGGGGGRVEGGGRGVSIERQVQK